MITRATEKQIQIFKAITRIHQNIGTQLDLGAVSQIVVEELAAIVSCVGCAMLIIEGEIAKILAERGFAEEMLNEKEFNADMPAIKYILDTKQSICRSEAKGSIACGCLPVGRPMKSLICTPIVVKDQVRAIIHIDSPNANAFDDQDVHFIKLLAEEISIAWELSSLYTQIKTLSIKDSATGCYNRKQLDEDLNAELVRAKRYERSLSLLMIDIDWLKEYNDFHGPIKGNELLQKIVGIFKNDVRSIDKVYRHDGEEFVILLPETAREKALSVAKRLQKLVEQKPFEGETESQPNKKITVSIGAASYPWDGNTKKELLESAETALAQAKQSGRNCVVELSGVDSSRAKLPRL